MRLKIDIHNCYGIGAMTEDVVFTEKENTAIVYAPNGSMKTSLTKTIKQLIGGKEPCDELYPTRVSSASITLDGTAINKDNTYVFENNDIDGSKQISTFLANAALKSEYDAIYQQLDDGKRALKKHVKQIAKSSDCEEEILDAFKENDDDNLFDCLLMVRRQLETKTDFLEGFSFKFNDVFERGGKVKEFILENQATIQRYFEKYTELIKGSKFFCSDARFGTSQANSLLKSVGDNRFFLAGHKFELGGEDVPRTITNKDDMERVIAAEMQRIFTDDDIKALFNELEGKLDKNVSLKGFKDVIQTYPELIPELVDYDAFQRKVLRGYLKQCEAELYALTELYLAKKGDLKDIVHRANAERSQWEKVIDLFNARFSVPFKLGLQNKSDILLNSKTPELQFLYRDGDDAPIAQERKTLVENLSAGEKKAFFILQNIFELEARRISRQETLLVFDDIADSFDYKNKYAIIEYLNDLSRDGNFNSFILTHNFDFYRTVVSRLYVGSNLFFVDRNEHDRSVRMCKGIYKPDILKNKLLNKISERRAFIGCIPFVRNIIEYTQGDDSSNYLLLTSCLHKKVDTEGIKMADIWDVFRNAVKTTDGLAISFGEEKYLTAIDEEAEAVLTDPNDVEIVNKLVLSMAIRLKAEEFMESVLTDEQKAEMRRTNRTGELLRIMKKYHLADMEDKCLLMNKVVMLTSENIHVNNFMFEPLVDISIHHLKRLYDEVKSLRETSAT